MPCSKAGAGILSVLTEPKWFKGSLDDLRAVRQKTQEWASDSGSRRPAVLRKDFLIDKYQVLEAVASGADTALLMASILSRSKLKELIACCREEGIEPLVEVVNRKELEVAGVETETIRKNKAFFVFLCFFLVCLCFLLVFPVFLFVCLGFSLAFLCFPLFFLVFVPWIFAREEFPKISPEAP